MGLIKTTLFIVGTCIGAGFLSGAELVRFFPTSPVLPAVLLSSLLFFALTSLFLLLGREHGGYHGALVALFGRGALPVKGILSLLSLIPCAGMLAGLDALLPRFSPLLSLSGLALVLLFLRRGMKGISLLNAVLVPLLLAFVVAYARGGTLNSALLPRGASGMGAVYAGMNVLLAVPVLADVGKEAKRPVLSAFLASVLIAGCACLVLGAILREGEGALRAELPFLRAMGGKGAFCAASALAILTSLGSSLYPLLRLCDGLRGKKRNAAKGIVPIAAFGLSRLGLSGIVRIFYPVLGAAGLLFSIICIFYEYFFQKHHKKVHPGGEQAEEHNGGHHKVQLEHLSAVHDEVPQPRPRNDIFAHDGADPAHAHGHL